MAKTHATPKLRQPAHTAERYGQPYVNLLMKKIAPILVLILISCSTARSTLEYGRYIKNTTKTLDLVPANDVVFKANGFYLHFSIDEILYILRTGERSLLSVESVRFIENQLQNQQSYLTKTGLSFVLNDTILIKYPISYDIEYSMDKLVKKGMVYVSESGLKIEKLTHKKWQPRIQGQILSQWISNKNKIINEFQEGFVD